MSKYSTTTTYKDIGTIMLENRNITLVGEVNDSIAYSVVSALLVLANESKDPIHLFINSPGGSVHAGLAIIDTMNLISAPVYTHGIGLCASMGAAILCCGEKGHRYATPNTSIMLHQVSSSTGGNIQDQRVSLMYTEELNKRLLTMIAKACGKTYEEILEHTNRDCWMFAEEAVTFGVIDELEKKEEEE